MNIYIILINLFNLGTNQQFFINKRYLKHTFALKNYVSKNLNKKLVYT